MECQRGVGSGLLVAVREIRESYEGLVSQRDGECCDVVDLCVFTHLRVYDENRPFDRGYSLSVR